MVLYPRSTYFEEHRKTFFSRYENAIAGTCTHVLLYGQEDIIVMVASIANFLPLSLCICAPYSACVANMLHVTCQAADYLVQCPRFFSLSI